MLPSISKDKEKAANVVNAVNYANNPIDQSPIRCAHCGEPVTANPIPGKGRANQEEIQFCCKGCEFVFNTINGLGLADFYKQSVSGKTIERRETRFTYLDTEPALAKWTTETTTTDGKKVLQARFALEGIHCAGCIWLIEQLPNAVPGLVNVRLHFERGEVLATYDPTRIKLSRLAATLSAIGYNPTPVLTTDDCAKLQEKEMRILLTRLGVAGFASANTMLIAFAFFQSLQTGMEPQYGSFLRWTSLLIALPSILYSGIPIFRSALGALKSGVVQLDLPLSTAIVGGAILSIVNTIRGNNFIYWDSVTALIFFLLTGRVLQKRALTAAMGTARRAWELLPQIARKETEDGAETDILAETIKAGDAISVLPGEVLPVDGTILSGRSYIDRSAITGEAQHQLVETGETVMAGTINLGAKIIIRADVDYRDSEFCHTLKAAAEGLGPKPRIVSFANSVASPFALGVLVLSALVLVYWSVAKDLFTGFENALSLLIVTCPCALGIATPIAMTIARSKAAKMGVLIRGDEAIERLASVSKLVFDKTGTLTSATPAVLTSFFLDQSEHDFTLQNLFAALAKSYPNHPLSRTIAECLSRSDRYEDLSNRLSGIHYEPGRGIEANDDSGEHLRLGALSWMGADLPEKIQNQLERYQDEHCSLVYCQKGEKIVGVILLTHKLRTNAASIIKTLGGAGKECYILSGDNQPAVDAVAVKLGIPPANAVGGLTPNEKQLRLEALGDGTAFVGDGLNDILAMKQASASVAVSGGIEAMLDYSDVFIRSSDISLLPVLFFGAKRAVRNIHLILGVSLVYNVTGAMLASLGLVNPLIAALMMPASSLTAILLASTLPTFKRYPYGV